MSRTTRPVLATAAAVPFVLLLLTPALRAQPDPGAAIAALERAAGGPLRVSRSRLTGAARFISVPPGRGIPLGPRRAAPAAERARTFVSAHGAALGLGGANEVAVSRVHGPDAVGMEHVRLRQLHAGIPITAGEVVIHVRGESVVAVNADTLRVPSDVATTPTVSAAEAVHAVEAVLTAGRQTGEVTLSAPRLEIFNRGIFDGRQHPTHLAWQLEATGPGLRELIWIDATSGVVLWRVNQIADALNREVYDAMHTSALPGTLVRSEGDPPTGDADVDEAYDFSGDTYDYYLNEHGRDSFNGAGATMVATVRSCPGFCGSCPCFNAYWIGSQTIFGELLSDDIVGHEWTHGVTQYTANLIYFEQSGALNESYSDIFGETVDQLNGTGMDTPAAKWWIFEDFFATPNGIRNMSDPTVRNDPGKMTDPQLYCGSDDAGGVHTNSGIGNHAYALMVDGGTYNGFTIAGIGLTKAGKIMYRTLTLYLTSGADFADNHDAVEQSCADLVGTAGITTADCDAVRDALDAVEMNLPWPCTCGNGTVEGVEECDDGNDVDADCCSATCLSQPCPLDHYKCYQGTDLKTPQFSQVTVATTDQIGSSSVEVQKVKFVCNPVDKNGEGIFDQNAHLTCYQVKGGQLTPRPHVELLTQFQPTQFELKKPKLLCLPSTKTLLP